MSAHRLPGPLVVGVDGSPASAVARRWVDEHCDGPIGVVQVPDGSSGAGPSDVAEALLREVAERGAEAVVVGHEPRERFGAAVVGRTTAELLQAATCPVIIVPASWDPAHTEGRPVAVGVGVARGTRAAVDWIRRHLALAESGLVLVHALGPRSLFRPDGWLDVVAYHLDPSVVPSWVEEELADLAAEIVDPEDIDVEVVVGTGTTGARLLEAAETASLLVVGRGEPSFVRERVIAPYLRRAVSHAPCPVVVVPAAES